jgi:signal transduction histidine kinase
MASMEQRIRHVGGELQITSTSSGTRVTARVPFTTQVHRTGADRCA